MPAQAPWPSQGASQDTGISSHIPAVPISDAKFDSQSSIFTVVPALASSRVVPNCLSGAASSQPWTLPGMYAALVLLIPRWCHSWERGSDAWAGCADGVGCSVLRSPEIHRSLISHPILNWGSAANQNICICMTCCPSCATMSGRGKCGGLSMSTHTQQVPDS